MSSTLAPSVLSPNNPITDTSVVEGLKSLGVNPKEEDLDDYTSLLKGIWEIWNKVDQMDDYVPVVDEEKFPRKDVHRPEGKENEYNAWGWKAHVAGTGIEGPLKGKTLCLKDNVTLKGVPCLMGTAIFDDWVPETDATVVTRILEAGGIIEGKAVCENLSLWGVSCSSATGYMNNIYADGYSAGGSSSGTGVLVGRGIVDLGIGGDQGGSIRLPSAFNGIVGFKPTTGLVPYTGIAGLEPILDHAGPMTKTVLDNAMLLKVIAGADGIDDRQQAGCPFPGQIPDYPSLATQGVKGLKIGILREALDQPLHDPRVSAHVVAAAKKLEELGATVEEVSIPIHKEAPEIWAVIGRLSAAQTLMGRNTGRRTLALNDLTDKMMPLTQEKFDRMFVSGVNTIANGLWFAENMPPSLFGKATNLVRKLRDHYYAALDKYDVLVMPTTPMLAPRLPPKDSNVTELMKNSAGVSLNTSAFNLTGQPALSLPVGFLPSPSDPSVRLPVGMQIVGKFYAEPTIYRVAYAWEQAFDWKTFA
ncbi:amidase signature domain-containing protein [Naematelia encephala]|uniref:Amidase signature domain-containing protein n=1 Tax=Naematelia encephala TaxID=71784 RepID=A0A1Y2B806_9TREE|nr:amidase signature domain-containing protein [Naematelia encephala]